MTLAKATNLTGEPLNLPGKAPFRALDLLGLVGVDFNLPCEDPWIHEKGATGHGYLDGAEKGWREYPDWMDFLDEDSPCWDLKRAERDLYLHWWRPWMKGKRFLDLGCGVGRFTQPLLDRGAEVIGIDGDILSLRRCAWHAAGREGSLDLHWTTLQKLPDVGVFDAIIACEVLCYLPDAESVMHQIVKRLKPGGAFLASVEARWGWAASTDAPGNAVAVALGGDGIIDIPDDRWVRTFEREDFTELLTGAGLHVEEMQPTHYFLDGPLEGCLPNTLNLESTLAMEAACRNHRIWAPLNRAWTAVATREAD